MTIRDYFEAEMRRLQQEAQTFAAAYPEQAGLLNLQALHDRDPYIERLLEGVAYLTAQIQQRLDEDLPELSETLLQQFCPNLLRAFPSATIIQFQAKPHRLTTNWTLPAGTLLQSARIGEEQITCYFRTIAPVTLLPLQLTQTEHEQSASGSIFRLHWQCLPNVQLHQLDLRHLSLYLHADPSIALDLHYLLTTATPQVKIHFPTLLNQPSITLTKNAIRYAHFAESEMLLPITERNFYGLQLLQEYFAFREKYAFIVIDGLKNITWPAICQQFIIEIVTQKTISYTIPTDIFRPYCIPAVNLFSSTSEPIALKSYRYEQAVIPDLNHQEGLQLHSVDQVIGYHLNSGMQQLYQPMTYYHHQPDTAYYQLITRPQANQRWQTYLSLSQTATADYLSCAITVSNGHYPRRYLQEKQLQLSDETQAKLLQGYNLLRPSNLLAPPDRSHWQWLLLTQLNVNFGSLTELSSLQKILQLCDWSQREEHRRRIASIKQLTVQPEASMRGGILQHQLSFRLNVHEEGFRSIGDLHLFGLVLHHFFMAQVAINYAVSTYIFCYPSQRELTWHSTMGQNPVI